MATVFDVAQYILQQTGEISAMKLQKLVYYSQAWSTVWEDEVIFNERIEAWANGPVAPDLYSRHRGVFKLSALNVGNAGALNASQRSTVDAVLEYYGPKSAQYLSELTHAEAPWKDAREGLQPGERGEKEITPAAMAEYYGSLTKAEA